MPTGDDAVATTPGTPVVVDVLANDCHSSLAGQSDTITTTESVNGADSSVRVGSASEANNEVLYKPPAGFTGTVTFTYWWREVGPYLPTLRGNGVQRAASAQYPPSIETIYSAGYPGHSTGAAAVVTVYVNQSGELPPTPARAGGPYPTRGVIDSEAGSPSEGCNCARGHAGDPVDTSSGAFSESAVDLVTPGRGQALGVARTFSSTDADTAGPFGFGWSWSYGASLTRDPSSGVVTVLEETGSSVAFTPGSTAGSYTPVQPRVLASLSVVNGQYVFVRRQRETMTFNSAGSLTGITDVHGYTTTLGYDGTGTLALIIDPAGRSYSVTMAGGHVSAISDGATRTVQYGYDSAGNLTSVTDPAGTVTTYGYDSAHRLTTRLDPRQYGTTSPVPVSNTYDSQGRVMKQSDQLGRSTTFDYSSIPGATKVTDPAGAVTVDYYTDGLRTKTVTGYGAASSATTSFAYDAATEQLASVTDPNNGATTYKHDPQGNLTQATDPLNRTTSSTFDALNDPLTVTDPAGVTATNTYTTSGDLATASAPLLAADGRTVTATRTTTYTYGDSAHSGDVTAVTDPNGNTTVLAYDGYGDLVSSTGPATTSSPAGNKTTFGYDGATGRRTSVTSPKGNAAGANPAASTTTYSYDADGRLLQTRDAMWSATAPNLHQTSSSYDADGNVTAGTDADGHTTSYTYDAANQLTATTRPDSTVLHQAWTPAGQLASGTDAKGHTTTYTYTARGQLATSTDALSRTTGYGYDLTGNLILTAKPGATCTGASPGAGCIAQDFDNADRLTARRYLDGPTANVAWQYDADNRRTSMTDSTGTSSYSYDSLGRLTSTTNGAGSTTGYGYDLDGNTTTITYPGNRTVHRSYDAANHLTAVTDWLNHTTGYGYDADSDPTTTAFPAGTGETDTTGYDQLDRVTSITDAQSSSTLASFSYGRDSAGQVSSETDSSTGNPAQTYTYNTLNQLVSSGKSASPTSYTYDAGDNITNRATTAASDASTQAFDAGNQLCWSASSTVSSPQCASPPAGAPTYSYNTSGDRTAATLPNGGRSTYGYDEADQLTTSTSTALASVDNFVPLTPARAVDTRNGTGNVPTARLAPNASITYQATGSNGIPVTGVAAVAFNMTAVGPSGSGVVRVAPAGSSNTLTPLNYYNGQGITGMVISQVGTGGAVTITNYGGTIDLVVDVVGYYTTPDKDNAGDGFVPVAPARALDTRNGTGNVPVSRLAANQSVTYQAGGYNGIPTSGVSSVVFNMTAVNPAGAGVVRVAAAGSGSTSTPLNYYDAQGITGMVVTQVGTGGAVTITNYGGTIDLVVDVVGYYTTPSTASAGNGFVPVTPARALDTRTGAGGVPVGRLAPNQSISYHAAGNNGVPASGVTAVVFNMTAVGPSGTGVVRVAPGGTSNYIVPINYYTGQGITGMVITKLGADGTVTILNAGGTIDVAVDLVGYYTAENTASTSSYTYNGDGLRTSKTTDGATSAFTWDVGSGGLPVLESDTVNTYLYGIGDLPLEQINNTTGAVSYLHHDQLGSTRILTNTTGSITATQNYDPYGKPTLTTGTPSPLGYTGQYTDTDTGFLYLRARYYDPTTAQFTTIDPLLATTGQAYAYAANNPTNTVDPTGRSNSEERGDAPGGEQSFFFPVEGEGFGGGESNPARTSLAGSSAPGEGIDDTEPTTAPCTSAVLPGVPDGWSVRTADSGKGQVWQAPGAVGNANSIRVMAPTDQYSYGYVASTTNMVSRSIWPENRGLNPPRTSPEPRTEPTHYLQDGRHEPQCRWSHYRPCLV
jgi:RHS repeat-associated protein